MQNRYSSVTTMPQTLKIL